MTVRQMISAIFALAALGLLAGCGRGDTTPFSVETDEPAYRQGQQLLKQGREAEALSQFLKVIEKRGEQASAESHLEAGVIFLNHTKDPIEAIHHFRKYLELQPNSLQASKVRGLIEIARREFARTIPGHPLESEVIGVDQSDRIKSLEREVEDLKADNTLLRSMSAAPLTRLTHATTEGGDAATPAEAGLRKPPSISVATDRPATPARGGLSLNAATLPPKPTLFAPAPAGKPASNATAGRRHTVAPHETLYGIARKYGVTVEAIVVANPQALPSVNTPLRAGTELKIP